MITNHNQARVFVLRLMQDNKIRARNQIYEDSAKLANISESELNIKIASGQSKVYNCIGWAISSFTKAGILNRLERATYQISEIGLEIANKWQSKTEIYEKDFVGLPKWDEYLRSIAERKNNSSEVELPLLIENSDNDISLDEKINIIVKSIEDEVAVELLDRLKNGTPLFFEQAVINVLLAMGYGGKEKLSLHTGKSHDGGIDGVIKQDPLGIQNIYIQAKRYGDGNSIGSKEIQSFVGALQGHGVERGVFITTSSFTSSAKDYVSKLLGRIVLIDGQELVTLMIRYRVGVQIKRTINICQIDEDFFE